MASKAELPTQTGRLEQVLHEYAILPPTPELLTETFQTIWEIRSLKSGTPFPVSSCDRTQEEIDALEREGRRLIYVPTANLGRLTKAFPSLNAWQLKKCTFTNADDKIGWIDVEASDFSPYPSTTESMLRGKFAQKGKMGMRLFTYVIASYDHKLFTGRYFDERSKSRLLGTFLGGTCIFAGFNEKGELTLDWELHPGVPLEPRDQFVDLGGRSEGAAKDTAFQLEHVSLRPDSAIYP